MGMAFQLPVAGLIHPLPAVSQIVPRQDLAYAFQYPASAGPCGANAEDLIQPLAVQAGFHARPCQDAF